MKAISSVHNIAIRTVSLPAIHILGTTVTLWLHIAAIYVNESFPVNQCYYVLSILSVLSAAYNSINFIVELSALFD